MAKTRLSSIFLLIISGLANHIFGSEVQWFGSAHDRDWFNTANWGPNGAPIPTGIDKAKINYVWANPGPIIRTPAEVNEIFISEDHDLGTAREQSLVITAGGVLTATGQVLLGYLGFDRKAGLPPNEGSFIVEGGTANLVSHLFVGFGGKGHLIIKSGTLNVCGMLGVGWNGGQGDIVINGGTLHTEEYNLSPTNANGTAHVTINGGQWIQNHYWKPQIESLIAKGTITSDKSSLQVRWDPNAGSLDPATKLPIGETIVFGSTGACEHSIAHPRCIEFT